MRNPEKHWLDQKVLHAFIYTEMPTPLPPPTRPPTYPSNFCPAAHTNSAWAKLMPKRCKFPKATWSISVHAVQIDSSSLGYYDIIISVKLIVCVKKFPLLCKKFLEPSIVCNRVHGNSDREKTLTGDDNEEKKIAIFWGFLFELVREFSTIC